MKKKIIIPILIGLFLVVGYMLYNSLDSSKYTTNTKDKSEQSSLITTVSNSLSSTGIEESVSEASRETDTSISTSESSESVTNHAEEDKKNKEIKDQASKVMSIKEAREEMRKSGMNDGDFSDLDISKYINDATSKGKDLIDYLKEQGF
ncbi:hypothetical protein BG261_04080 [Floricoccus tropicus]|uniref:Uncharacterized protein n=1 Tax=Floricoccus tropicus TaxID=1859473 RepID=A0A1E8GLE4_9LACT|nr:hypothetical protein [Floricoccus tropicus]OFI49059.1 hypothetical protein BG261_04080 [Floricoccus tropicus]